jgi:hypothetical protein
MRSHAFKRLVWLYRQLLRRMRALERAAGRAIVGRVFMRVQIETLQPRMLMSVTPSGVETAIDNSTTEQMVTPAIAMDPAGSSVAVWTTGDMGGHVFGQLYNSSGAAVGSIFQIDQVQPGGHALPAVAMDTAGDFAVSWNGNGNSIYVRLFTSTGAAVTGQTLVTSQKMGPQYDSSIAMTASGAFAVVWEGNNSSADNDGIYVQQFTSAGVATGAITLVNTTTQGPQQNPSIAADPGGDYAISWTDRSSGQKIKAAYWPAGGGLSSEFAVGAGGNVNEDFSQVSFDGTGHFVVAYAETGPGQIIYARRFAGTSAIDAAPLLVSGGDSQPQVKPAIAGRADGSFLVAWTSNGGGPMAGAGNDGSGKGVFAQAFTATGGLDGAQFQVNTTTQMDQQDAAVAWSGNTAVIAWDSNAPNPQMGVFLQRYVTTGPANQPPVNTVPGSQSIDENNTLTFSSANGNAVSVADPDGDGGVEQVTLTASSGTLTLSGVGGLTFSSGSNGSAAMTFSGALANLDVALRGMGFTPAANFTGTAQIHLVSNDLGNTGAGGAQSATGSFAVNVDPPPSSNTVPGSQTTTKNTALVFSPQNDNAIYIGSGWSEVQLDATHGTLTLSRESGLSFSSGNGIADTTMQFSGSIANMNAAIAGMRFSPAAGYLGAASVKVTTINSGLLGLGLLGSSSSSTIAITVAQPPDQPPTVSVPATQSTAEGSALIFSGGGAFSVSDSDANGSAEQLTLTALNGTLALGSKTGLSFSAGNGAGDASMTFTGTLANINAAIATLTFMPASLFYGSGSVSASIDDLGNSGTGGPLTANATVTINVTQVNQAPAVAVPPEQTLAENGTLAFSSAGGNAIVISDVDAAGAAEQVTLSTAAGALALGSSANLTLDSGGDGQASMTLTGTLPDINAALATLTFTPAGGFTGTAAVQISVNDLGNTGAGGAQTTNASVSVAVIQSLVVTTASDVSDGDTSSIANLLASPGADGMISLREAIQAVDNTAGSYAIDFNIAGNGAHIISVTSALPSLSNSMAIDGTSQPGYAASPLIVIDGSGAPPNTDGLSISVANCAILGLAIDGFNGAGINVTGVNHTTIAADYIGLDASGAAAGNGAGISLSNAGTNLIGGSAAALRNVISGNTGDGIDITGASSRGNVIAGNFIGTNPAGSAAIANGGIGISVSGGAAGNAIGTQTLQANLAAAFNRPGIVADGSSFATGFDGAGSAFSANLLDHSLTFNGSAYTFGPAGGNNVVFASGQTITLNSGIDSTLSFLAAAAFGSQLNQTFTVTYTDNTTQNFTQSFSDWGIATTFAGQTAVASTAYRDTFTGGMSAGPYTVYGYSFALDSSKSLKSITLPNNHNVILLAMDATLAQGAAGNLISGNGSYGVEIAGATSTGNLVQGNFIGTDASGLASISNGNDGVYLNATTGNTIGGASAAARNILSGNTSAPSTADGIWINGGSFNTVQGNYIGTDATGAAALGNNSDGIIIASSTNNQIGGAAAGAGNLVSGNGAYGIEIDGPSAGGNRIQGNFVGANAAGNASISNGNDGIWLNGVTNTTIGGTLSGAGNLISGNTAAGPLADGIWILNGSANIVQGNSIGTDITGTANLGNDNNGIAIDASSNNQIGGAASGAANVIAFNNKGVDVFGSGAMGNSIRENSIFSNTAIGIDLADDGITPNTGTVSSLLPNNGMNFPVFTVANVGAGMLNVSGYVGNAPNQSAFAGAVIDLYVSDHSSSNGQGITWIGTLTADGNGNFSAALADPGLIVGDTITATATDGAGNTSEFAANAAIVPAPVAHTPSVTNAATNENQQSASGLVITANPLDAGQTVYFQISNIIGGSLFLNDGETPVSDGNFITSAEGAAGLDFTPAANSYAPGGFDVQASLTSDISGLGGSTASATIMVDALPVVTVDTTTLGYTEGHGPVALDPTLTVADPDSPELASATVTLGGYVSGEDVLAFNDQSGITGSWDAVHGVLTLSGAATPAQYQSALASVTYADTSLDPSTAPRAVEFIVNDGSANSAPADRPIAVIAINTPPQITGPTALATVRNLPLVISSAEGNAIGVSDVDADGGTEEVTLSVAHGVLTLATGANLAFQNGAGPVGSSTDFIGTLADIQAALDGMIYTPDSGYSGADSLTIHVNDLSNTGSGGAQTALASVHIAVLPGLTVDTTADVADGNTSSIQNLLENDGPDGRISLREAIAAVNNTAGQYAIDFAIPGSGVETIAVASALPAITSSMTIDGTSQADYAGTPLIAIDGTFAGNGVNGFTLNAGNSTLRGLAIDNFSGSGIAVNSVNGVTLAGNFIGLTPAGARAGNGTGITLAQSNNCTIGGTTAADRNVISGNIGDGVFIFRGSGNIVQGNSIGVDAVGTAPLGNNNDGVEIASSSNNQIGANAAGAGNVIAYNNKAIVVSGAGAGNSLLGNSIHGNTSIGIDLGDDGITANTGSENGSLPNQGMNFPVITSSVFAGGKLHVTGYIGSARGQAAFAGAQVDFYLADTSTVISQGARWLGSITAHGGGNFSGSIATSALANGDNIIATATDPSLDTSEFSPTFLLAPAHTPTVSSASTNENEQTISGLVLTADPLDSRATVFFKITHITGGTLFFSDGITAVSNGAFITAAQGLAGLRFTPAPDSAATGSFSAQASLLDFDAGLGGNIVTATISVNGPPVVIASATPLAYIDRQGPAAIDPALAVSDSDSPALAGATVTLIGYVAGEDLLGFTNQNGISGTWDSTTGVLTLSGAATPAQYQTALESVTYTDSNRTPSATSRIAQFIVNDGALDSAPADRSITLTPPVPQLTDKGLVADANLVATIPSAALAAAEVGASSDQLTFTVTTPPALGTLKLAGQALAAGGTFTESDIEQGRLTYTPAAPKTADDSFTFIVTDAGGVSLPAAVFQIHAVQTITPPPPDIAPPDVVPPAATTPAGPPAPLLPPSAPIVIPPVDLGTSSGGGTISGLGTTDTTNAAPASSTPSGPAESGTGPRAAVLAPPVANPGAVFVAPLLPHAPPVKALEVPAPDFAAPAESDKVAVATGDVVGPPLRGTIAVSPLGPGTPGKTNVATLGSPNYGNNKFVPRAPATFAVNSPLWNQLDKMQEKMASERKLHIIAGTASLVSVGMSVMYFLWAVRAGSVLSSLLSSMPAWKLVDPLPILDQFAGKRRMKIDGSGDDMTEDDETLESMVDGPRKAA